MITRLDHLVLTVASIPSTVRFYTEVLGMREITFGTGRTALVFGTQKINLHEAGKEFEPKANHPTPGAADLCFISNTSIDSIVTKLRAHGVDIIEGPVVRNGARGPIISIYCRDPDGNLIEISNEKP